MLRLDSSASRILKTISGDVFPWLNSACNNFHTRSLVVERVIFTLFCYYDPYTWRFMGSYMWGYKSPNMGYNYSYPTYDYP